MRESGFRYNLFNELRAIGEFINVSDTDLNFRVFKHPAGNRLTFDGLKLLKKIYDCYEFKFTIEDSLSTRHLIALSREIKFPYYISNGRLVVFNREDAFLIKLYGSNLREWLDNSGSVPNYS